MGWKEEGCFHSLLFLCLNSLQSRITFFKIKENTADKSASTKKRALVLGEKNTDQNLGHLCLLNSPETQSWSSICNPQTGVFAVRSRHSASFTDLLTLLLQPVFH